MSAPTYRMPPKLRALIRERGVTVVVLAERAGVPLGRALRVVSGHPDGRTDDRTAIARWLTAEERKALGWNKDGQLFPVEQSVEHLNKVA